MTWETSYVPDRLDGASLKRLLPAMVGDNVDFLRRNPDLPLLYQLRPRYVEDPADRQRLISYAQILRLGRADCKSFSCARVAELRQRFRVDARCVWPPPDLTVPDEPAFHIVVLVPACAAVPDPRTGRPGRHVEDPSAILGMGWNGLPPGAGGAGPRRVLPEALLRRR